MRFDIQDSILMCCFEFYIGTISELHTALKGYVDCPSDEVFMTTSGMTINMHHAVVVWLPEFNPNKADDMGTLVHECLHATTARINECHIEDEEFSCYYLQFLVRAFLNKYKAEVANGKKKTGRKSDKQTNDRRQVQKA